MGVMRVENDFLICQLILNECSNDKFFGEVGIIGFKNPPIQVSSVPGATEKNEFYLGKLICKIFDNLHYCCKHFHHIFIVRINSVVYSSVGQQVSESDIVNRNRLCVSFTSNILCTPAAEITNNFSLKLKKFLF